MNFTRKIIQRKWSVVVLMLSALFLAWHITAGKLNSTLVTAYHDQESQILYDRNGTVIQIKPNSQGNYNQYTDAVPERFKALLLKKEDRFFYTHPGVDVGSIGRDIFTWIFRGRRSGSSTITQQLVKILLANENQRTWTNKLKELLYTESLEWKLSKDEILAMYANSAYFGGQTQGLTEASEYYFSVPPQNLSDAQILSLLVSLSSPSRIQPGSSKNIQQAKVLAKSFSIPIPEEEWTGLAAAEVNSIHRQSPAEFETESLGLNCAKNCALTLDSKLTENIRSIVKRNLSSANLDTAANGAVVVIKLPENELVSIVGSPDPASQKTGMQLNMALKPRAIGSTSKPFIYLNAFQKGARPYSLVDDSEIKYQIGTGFDFFPKNFDGQYRGLVTLHEALSNSLNIPSVQVLGFVGLNDFYSYLKDDLGFVPQQPLENYELGIALGGLESDLATLSHFFSVFPQQGYLKPLTLYKSGFTTTPYFIPPMGSTVSEPKQVGKLPEVQLVNRILNDRETGVDQFGLKSNLNLPYKNYALKTGTSRDYHDSWTIGYTPDFLVGVWVGNSDNRPMRQVTGLSGAAKIWHEVMEDLYNSSYNKNTPFDFSKTTDVQVGNTLDFGLKNDAVEAARSIMLNPSLITSPHDNDKFLLVKNTTIPLAASEEVEWFINGNKVSGSQSYSWRPSAAGEYTIEAKPAQGKSQKITVYLNNE